MNKTEDKKPLDESLGFILASNYRKQLMTVLENGPMTGSRLSEITGIHASHVSNTLKELRKRDLVECVNPEQRKGRLFTLTDKGRELRRKFSAQVKGETAEKEVADVLNELSIPYAKNLALEFEGQEIVPDFTILEDSQPRMIVEVKVLPDDAPEGLREYAFSAEKVKKEIEDLKTVLVLFGSSKKIMARSIAGSFIRGNYFDAVLHEEDLDCIRNKKLNLEKLLEVGKHCVDWPREKE